MQCQRVGLHSRRTSFGGERVALEEALEAMETNSEDDEIQERVLSVALEKVCVGKTI